MDYHDKIAEQIRAMGLPMSSYSAGTAQIADVLRKAYPAPIPSLQIGADAPGEVPWNARDTEALERNKAQMQEITTLRAQLAEERAKREWEATVRATLWDALYDLRYPGATKKSEDEIAYAADVALELNRSSDPRADISCHVEKEN